MSALAKFASKLAELAATEFGLNFPWLIQVHKETESIELKVIDHGMGPIPGYLWTAGAIEAFSDMCEVIIGEGIEHIKEQMHVCD